MPNKRKNTVNLITAQNFADCFNTSVINGVKEALPVCKPGEGGIIDFNIPYTHNMGIDVSINGIHYSDGGYVYFVTLEGESGELDPTDALFVENVYTVDFFQHVIWQIEQTY